MGYHAHFLTPKDCDICESHTALYQPSLLYTEYETPCAD